MPGPIYTKTGDNGMTGIRGCRVSKASNVIEAVGAIDELSCYIGVLKQFLDAEDVKTMEIIQQHLYLINASVAFNEGNVIGITDAHVSFLEKYIDDVTCALPPLTDFILP
eukprot:2408928-Rhodomonas_salina.1